MSNNKSIKKVVLLFLLLLAPVCIYLLLTSGKHNLEPLTIYGPRRVVESGSGIADTVYHTIPKFALINQFGDTITREDMEGKIVVADFFFTSCKTICKDMRGQMMRVQDKFKTLDDFLILSFTVDPETDTKDVLASYAEGSNAIANKWHFLTGNKSDIYTLGTKGFFVVADEDNSQPEIDSAQQFIHSNKFILLDKQGRIRGIYDGDDRNSVKALMDDVKYLKFSESIPRKND